LQIKTIVVYLHQNEGGIPRRDKKKNDMKTYKEIFNSSEVAKVIMTRANEMSKNSTAKEIKEIRELALMLAIALDKNLMNAMSERVYDKIRG